MRATKPKFTLDEAQRAADEWGMNCGPGAVAAICGLTLDQVRSHFDAHGFATKHYTNPTMMLDVLRSIAADFRVCRYPDGKYCDLDWPRYGLARIQWEGPWTKPGVPMRVRYRHTHWVGVERDPIKGVGIFDINMMANGQGWGSLQDWRTICVPWILDECVPRADGKWHLTHGIEIG